jgi:hypothetical protein
MQSRHYFRYKQIRTSLVKSLNQQSPPNNEDNGQDARESQTFTNADNEKPPIRFNFVLRRRFGSNFHALTCPSDAIAENNKTVSLTRRVKMSGINTVLNTSVC